MDFRLQKGQRCVIWMDRRETEAVKIAVSNLAGDLGRTLGVSVQISQYGGKEPWSRETNLQEPGTAWKGSQDGEANPQEPETAWKGPQDGEANLQESGTAWKEAQRSEAKAQEPRTGENGLQGGAAEQQEPWNTGSNGGTEGIAEIFVGTLDVSEVVKDIVDIAKLRDAAGGLRKEAYLHRVREGRLFIAGSDRRGTIYGIYDLCEALGVSPWYFWADVPVKKRQEFILPEGYVKADYPSVEYRGIFINDEEELEAWVQNYIKEPTIGVKTYEKVFELLLRLKANYIWPAMHVNSFNLKPENGALADRMGIVVGTSHCDMLMRSNNREWRPWIQKKGYTNAVYDYSIEGQNRDILREYWKESVEQNQDFEVCYTLGMRGIHDSGFATKNLKGSTEEEVIHAKVELLEKIIQDQRKILQDTLGHDTMMTFIPYKEVLKLYDNGLKIPEDMTLVWANDNYGYIRRYPSEAEKKRKGGNGIYYHNSYWSPPSMSYVFLCSIPLAHTRNELQKAWDEGIRKLWVLNSGAMKPLEQEITFFLRLAWEIGKPGALTEDVEAFVEDWIDRAFTGGIGKQVSVLLNDFSQLTNVHKVENMDYDAFSQTAYGDEAVVRIHRYEELFARGNELYAKLPEEEKGAFFQLVLMRIHAAYFTNLAYYYGDRSTLMYERGNMQAAAYYTEQSREAEDARRRLLHYYNHVMCDGKWNGILNPEGFPPPRAAMMPVCTPPLAIEGEPSMRVDIWNGAEELCFVTPGEKWIEIGNTGTGEFEVSLQAPEWVKLSGKRLVIRRENRILVSVSGDLEEHLGEIVVENIFDGSLRRIPVRTVKTEYEGDGCALEEDGLVVLEGDAAEGVNWKAGDLKGVHPEAKELKNENWKVKDLKSGNLDARNLRAGNLGSHDFRLIRRLGRMQGNLVEACVQREADNLNETIANETAENETAAKEAVKEAAAIAAAANGEPLSYCFATHSKGDFLLEIHRFPSLNSVGRLRIGISLDGGPVRVVESCSNDEWRGNWKKNVLHNVDRLYLELFVPEAGEHQLSVWAIDKYFAFSRMVIYTKPRKENNLAGIRGAQALPAEWEMNTWCDSFYGKHVLQPRPVYYAARVNDRDSVAVTCQMVRAEKVGGKVTPDWYLERGRHIFEEEGGGIRIDAASVLAQGSCAWTDDRTGGMVEGKPGNVTAGAAGEQTESKFEDRREGGLWRHCSSESFGRSGLAMYIRTPELRWTPEDAPSLNYRIRCGGGTYTLWMLSKFNVREEGFFGIGIDEEMIPQEELYGKGGLWRYEAEQIYRWVPAARIQLAKGEHVLHIYALASGMRYDRFYLTTGTEQPPMDRDFEG